MNPQLQERLSVAEQAAHWVRVLSKDDSQQSAAFVEWIKASPLHVRELLLASWLDEELNSIDPERRIDIRSLLERVRSNVSPIGIPAVAAAEPPEPAPAPQRGRLFKFAAGLAFIVVLASAAWVAHFVVGGRGTYVTRVGEQRVFELADGSVVFLNTQSKIQVRYSDSVRDIYLREGQALFQVRHNPSRPFRVHAAAAVIQAVGTQFDVRLYASHATVAVVEGAVQVSSDREARTEKLAIGSAPVAATQLKAGQAADIEAGGKVGTSVQVDAEAVTAWRQQRLVFEDKPLRDIANEFNRYNLAPRLHVEGDELGARRFNGSFNAHNPESLLNYLAHDQGVIFERNGEEVTIRARTH